MWKFLEQKKFYGKSSNCLTCAKLCFDWHESMNRVWFLFFANFPIARKNIWMADWWPAPSFIHISCELLLVLHLQITDWIHQWAWFLQPRVWTGVRICSRGGEGTRAVKEPSRSYTAPVNLLCLDACLAYCLYKFLMVKALSTMRRS